MPSTIHTSVGSPWADGSTVHAASPSLPWGDGTTIHASPSAYTAGPPAIGGTTTGSMPGVALYSIASRAAYDVAHTMLVTDLRDDAELDVDSLALSVDDGSPLWTLRASGGDALYSKLTAGEQPPQIKVDLDGEVWVFIVDSVSRTRTFGQSIVSVSGRSPAVAAGTPYEADQNWVNDGISTGAQIAAVANIYTGLEVSWEIEDWLVPDRVFSFSGTPLSVVARVAEAVGAVVQAHRSEYSVRVMPRYPLLPNEWSTAVPDVEVAFGAVMGDQYQRTDRPEYTGVYLAGQQQGAVGFVRLAGTSGAYLHPLVTDLLLTEEPALRMRGAAILGGSGGQAEMTLTLPLLTGAGEPGALNKGQLVRVLDPDGTWTGLVRGVSVAASLPAVTQTVVLERHTKDIDGTVGLPVVAPAVGPLFSLRPESADMSYAAAYVAAYPGSTPIGGTFDTAQVGAGVTFLDSLRADATDIDRALIGTVNKDSADGGPFHFEVLIGGDGSPAPSVGVFTQAYGPPFDPDTEMGGPLNVVYRSDGVIQGYGGSPSGYATFAAGDVVGVVLDPSGSTVAFFLNGTLVGTAGPADNQNMYVLCATRAGPTPLTFLGPIDDQLLEVGTAFSLDVSGEWAGGVSPLSWSVAGGTLPGGLSLDAGTGVLSGTPSADGIFADIVFRATDHVGSAANSNAVDVTVTAVPLETIVAVAQTGTNRAMTSTDGVTWTAQALTTARQWVCVAKGAGLWVAGQVVGSAPYIATSPDGVTWTDRSAQAGTWGAIAYGAGVFVAVGRSGTNRIMTSPDGITWTVRTAPTSQDWRSVVFADGIFVVVGNSTTAVLTSPDGITWTQRTGSAANSWQAATYGAGLFVAVSTNGGTTRAMTSPDGVTWTSRTTGSIGCVSIAFGAGVFVAVSAVSTDRVMTSPDGVTWTPRTAAEANSWRSVTYLNGIFIAVASDGTNRVMTSADGITWAARSASEANQWYGVA